MTNEQFKDWLEKYLRPQEQRSAETVKEIFTEDCTYSWGPFTDNREGLTATFEHHKNALSHQHEISYSYEILAVTPDYGLAHFSLSLVDDLPEEGNRYDGIFQVWLNGEGKCTRFEEWWHAAKV